MRIKSLHLSFFGMLLTMTPPMTPTMTLTMTLTMPLTMTPTHNPTVTDTNNHNNVLAVDGNIPSYGESCLNKEFDWNGQCTQMSVTLSLPCLLSSQLTLEFQQ
jgi:hypothetical protein